MQCRVYIYFYFIDKECSSIDEEQIDFTEPDSAAREETEEEDSSRSVDLDLRLDFCSILSPLDKKRYIKMCNVMVEGKK